MQQRSFVRNLHVMAIQWSLDRKDTLFLSLCVTQEIRMILYLCNTQWDFSLNTLAKIAAIQYAPLKKGYLAM